MQCDDLHNNGLKFDFSMKYLLLALTGSGLTSVTLISGYLGTVTQNLQIF